MTIDPFVSLAVWFVGAVVFAAVGSVLADDENEQLAAAFVAMTWPVGLSVALLCSPIWIGLAVAWLIKRKPKQ